MWWTCDVSVWAFDGVRDRRPQQGKETAVRARPMQRVVRSRTGSPNQFHLSRVDRLTTNQARAVSQDRSSALERIHDIAAPG